MMKLRDELTTFADYERYLLAKAELEERRRLLAETEMRLVDADHRVEGLMGLADAAREAEILALEETVRSINGHAKIYLDQFFEDPISITIRIEGGDGAKSKKKSTKLQLRLAIEYQGLTYEDVDELSGGERQRADTAFVLGVNDMLGSKILMLDECTTSLDAATNFSVLQLLRDASYGKMVIMVSHEAVAGTFDFEVPV
jgi:DNA repair exonuclease SbcCD ATPase subunit